MSSREITLWLDERWYQALTQQLEVKTLEEKLNEYLDDLIRILPTHIHDKVIGEIRVEDQQRQQELEASQIYSVLRVTEGGVTECFRMEQAVGMPEAASFVRRWLRQTERHPFQELLHGRESISAEEFGRMAAGCVDGDRKIAGVYDMDLETKAFSSVRPIHGWITYRLKDVSTASWHSYRTGSYDRERREARLMEKLAGREIVAAGHLSAEQFSFAEEITEDHGRLNFYLRTDFDINKAFGIRTAGSDDQLNVYANYDMAGGQVCSELELVLICACGAEESRTYPLNSVEKAALLQKMEDYCQEQTGQSLADYSAQLMAEEMTLPAGPMM